MRSLQASVTAESLGAGRMRLRIKSSSGEDLAVEMSAQTSEYLAKALVPEKAEMPMQPKAPTPVAPTPVSAPAPTPAPTPVPAPPAPTTPTAEPPKAPVSVPTPAPVSTSEKSAPQDGQKGS